MLTARCPVCQGPDAKPLRNAFSVPLVECSACGTGYVWPVPDPRELERRYAREYEAGKWQDLMLEPTEDELSFRERLAAGGAGPGRLLDVGCGEGAFLRFVRGRGWSAVGLEVAWSAAASASLSGVAVGGLDAVRADAGFDAITFWDVLEHVPEPLQMLRAARERLRPGGVVVTSLPSAVSTTARVERRRWRYYDLDMYGHLLHVGPTQLEALFEQADLDVVGAETRGSVDLRHSLVSRSVGGVPGALLDRVSGLLARWAVPRGLGNTLYMVGRRA